MTNIQRIDTIKQRVNSALKPSHCVIHDESQQHIGHPGAQSGAGHFAIEISAAAFNGKSKVTCHQMVYAAVEDLIPQEIHALRINIVAVASDE